MPLNLLPLYFQLAMLDSSLLLNTTLAHVCPQFEEYSCLPSTLSSASVWAVGLAVSAIS